MAGLGVKRSVGREIDKRSYDAAVSDWPVIAAAQFTAFRQVDSEFTGFGVKGDNSAIKPLMERRARHESVHVVECH